MSSFKELYDAVLKAQKYAIKYNMPEVFEEFYNYELNRGTFSDGPLKEEFENLKMDNPKQEAL
jgi:hypothetical protein